MEEGLNFEDLQKHLEALNEEVSKLGIKIKHHEENIGFLKSEIYAIDESILDMQGNRRSYFWDNSISFSSLKTAMAIEETEKLVQLAPSFSERHPNITSRCTTFEFVFVIFGHGYILFRLMGEKSSIFCAVGTFLCVTSILVAIYGFFYTLRMPKKIMKKLAFALFAYPATCLCLVSVLWLHIKDPDPYNTYRNIVLVISAACSILIGVESICSYVFDKDIFSCFKRKTNISGNPSIDEII